MIADLFLSCLFFVCSSSSSNTHGTATVYVQIYLLYSDWTCTDQPANRPLLILIPDVQSSYRFCFLFGYFNLTYFWGGGGESLREIVADARSQQTKKNNCSSYSYLSEFIYRIVRLSCLSCAITLPDSEITIYLAVTTKPWGGNNPTLNGLVNPNSYRPTTIATSCKVTRSNKFKGCYKVLLVVHHGEIFFSIL